ncbi:biotin/lipoyl-containing protein [Chloroflexota bacterium]
MAQEIIEVPLSGKITAVNVKQGDEVNEGDVLCTLEAMKMQNPILAPVAGTITEINVSVGETVETGGTIAIIEY